MMLAGVLPGKLITIVYVMSVVLYVIYTCNYYRGVVIVGLLIIIINYRSFKTVVYSLFN